MIYLSNEDEIIDVPLLKMEEWRTETFEANLADINIADRTNNEIIKQVVRLKFDDNGPDLDIFSVPESGKLADLKAFGKTSDLYKLISCIQSKGIKVQIIEGDGRFKLFRCVPSILGSRVRMVANKREYMGNDGEIKYAKNWVMEFIQLNDSALITMPKLPDEEKPIEREVYIPDIESVKKLIIEALEITKAQDPGKYTPISAIAKHIVNTLRDEKDHEKLIVGYSRMRDQAINELIAEYIIEKEKDSVLYRLI